MLFLKGAASHKFHRTVGTARFVSCPKSGGSTVVSVLIGCRQMKYDPDKRHRRSIRLRDYDYAQEGAYFVTICTRNRECLFGHIANGEIALNESGNMVEKWWLELNTKFPQIERDAYVVMPNHVHGVISIVGADLRVCPDSGARTGAPLQTIVQWFKTMTTNEHIRRAKNNSANPQGSKLWQRNYYEHVIRNESSLNAIREYIVTNPFNWQDDLKIRMLFCNGRPSLFLPAQS
jgi:putative transposase